MNGPGAGARRSRLERLYRFLLRMLPRAFRNAHGEDAAMVFRDQLRDARARGGLAAALRLMGRSAAALVACAARERMEWIRATRRPAGRGAKPERFRATGPGRGRANMPGAVLQDLRFAARSFRRRPGFALIAIGILGVGIGSITAIFSVVDSVLLRSLPYPSPDELVFFDEGAHSGPAFEEWQRALTSFEALGAAWDRQIDLTGDGEPARLRAALVTPELLAIFGARPRVGRLFVDGDFHDGPSVAVLGHGVWQRRWGGDPDIVGRRLLLDGETVVVAGVMGAGFDPPEALVGSQVDVWLPLRPGTPQLQSRGFRVLSVVGRLAPGATLERARAEMDALAAALADEAPQSYRNRDGSLSTIPLVPLLDVTVRRVSGTLYMLLGAVGLLLLLACANVANLLLARGNARAREIALRASVGASRRRVAGQLLIESVVLALSGGGLGVLIAYAGVEAMTRMSPGDVPRVHDVTVDPRILVFAAAVSVLTGVVFGILPALQAAREDVSDALKHGSASLTGDRRGRRLRRGLVAAEIALALVLLVGAGLLFRSFVGMVRVDPGIVTEHLVVVPLELGPTYEEDEQLRFAEDLMERVAAVPGVRGVAAGLNLPFEEHGRSRCCWMASVTSGEESEPGDTVRPVIHPVTEGYFSVLGARVLHGREFTRADSKENASRALVNLPTALRLFGTENAVGRTIRAVGETFTVVGVVEGVHQWGLDQEVEHAVYVPYRRHGAVLGLVHLAVRSDADLTVLAAALRGAVWSIDPDLPIPNVVTMDRLVSESLAAPRFLSFLVSAFAFVSLILACGGVYGSMLYSVNQRQREMGIRLAIGADGAEVVRLVLTDGLVVTLLGLGLGVAGALAASRVLDSLVWGVTTTDAVTYAMMAIFLGLAATAACFLPAWKAARTDPMRTLRTE